jgi:bacterioferritin-associated ferredoxin
LDPVIICSCNVLSEDDVRGAVAAICQQPSAAAHKCGRCARTIERMDRNLPPKNCATSEQSRQHSQILLPH